MDTNNQQTRAAMKAFIAAHEGCGLLPASFSHNPDAVRLAIDCPCGASHVSIYCGDVQVRLEDGRYVPIQQTPTMATITGIDATS
jgi:hypothetical protein